MKEKGIIHFIPLLIIAVSIIAVAHAYSAKSQPEPALNKSNILPSPTLTVTPSPTNSPTPTLKPTITFTPTPTPTATAVPTATATTAPKSSGSGNIKTEKGDFSAAVFSYDLNGVKMVTDTANENDCGNDCPTLSLQDFVNRNGCFAGVNGSYFCPDSYADCSGKKNSFDFPIFNTKLSRWINQGNLFWNFRAMVYFDGSGAHYLQNAKDFSGGLTAGIVNYPGLLADGNVQIDDNQSGLSEKQKAKGTKVGIGVKDNKNVIVVIAQNVNMQEFAYVFKSLGAKGALNLDTGGSTAFYQDGRYIFGPGRNLPNAVLFCR
jgi:exopolysaccharide biosynthesis protein